MNQNRKRIEFLTDAVNNLCGLPMMIIGLALCIVSPLDYLADLNSQRENAAGKDVTVGLLFILFAIIFFAFVYPKIRASYGRKFGRIKAKPTTFQSVLKSATCYVPLILGFVFGGLIDADHKLPFSVMILSISIFTFALWTLNYQGVSNTLLYLSIIFFAASFLPWGKLFLAVTVSDGFYARGAFYNNLSTTFLGIAYFVWGFDDYRILTKTLTPIKRGEEIYESV